MKSMKTRTYAYLYAYTVARDPKRERARCEAKVPNESINETQNNAQNSNTLPHSPTRRWYMIPELANREILEELLRTERTQANIVRKLGCTRTNVSSAIKAHGIQKEVIVRMSEEMWRKLRMGE